MITTREIMKLLHLRGSDFKAIRADPESSMPRPVKKIHNVIYYDRQAILAWIKNRQSKLLKPNKVPGLDNELAQQIIRSHRFG